MVTPILLASTLQTHGTFYIIVVLLAAAFLFVLLTLPETKVIVLHTGNRLSTEAAGKCDIGCFCLTAKTVSYVVTRAPKGGAASS